MSAVAAPGTRIAQRRPCLGSRELPAPIVADIQRFSLDNGPGIRSTVFFKGCALRCAWCHNPELQDHAPRVSYLADRCIGCRACLAACRNSPEAIGPQEACSGCGRCASACPTGALRMIGTRMDHNRLAALLLEDLPFYRVSGGGVTFSGGEPALFSRYCADTARILKAHSVHLAIQTAGMFPWEEFASTILPLIDQIYFDLKAVNAAEHRRLTGCRPEPIVENFRRLAAGPALLVATMVLVPGVNDDPRTIEAMRGFVHGCGITHFVTLPYIPENGAKRRRILTVPLRHLHDMAFPERHTPRSGAA
jgi:pyruvate formate lyase activating enzyme